MTPVAPLGGRGNTSTGNVADEKGGYIGKLDDIRIYKKALSSSEVIDIFNNVTCSDTTIYDTLQISVCDSTMLGGSYQNTEGTYYDTLTNQ